MICKQSRVYILCAYIYYFFFLQMKLMERWKKVAEESKLLDSYDSSS